MRRRRGTRASSRRTIPRRKKNFRAPDLVEVEDSVAMLVRLARRRAWKDHGQSFASDRERDMVASVYLMRATDLLRDELERER